MHLKNRDKKFVTLRSRGNEVVRVVGAGNRAFLEQADKLVLELIKRIADKTVDPAKPKRHAQKVERPVTASERHWGDYFKRN